MESSRVNKRIRAFRKLRGLTQLQLAEMTNLSITIIGEIERGNRAADDQVVERIAYALRISVIELVGEG
ncbi:MAG: helix-turn-helix transcriptional regulator [Paenibacillus sp.]|uniref:Helix-turn-helix n=1 Tax=Paenibacillus aquistagni TaxID=1852522 RepID=A0A1X7M035_9BACL|nr:helix-turn-helix transcriptional regulator [Paenibacillus aquistagni]MBR2567873.1 helix-turn-helix transcriptional regulator [Paenibacillus sp.]NMM55220.1 helix-turn-helix transcriptional regulator [Paenibacillus aquistagni]SMG59077.1 Helix-turn-helix [Paenibacillus aquistagni]